MSRRARERIAALTFLGLFVGAAWLSLDFGPRARMIPLPLAIFGALLAVVLLVLQQRGAAQDLQMDLIRVDRPAPPTHPDAGPGGYDPRTAGNRVPTARAQRVAYAIVGGLLAMILTIGPVASVLVFTAGYFLRTRYYPAPLALAYAGAFTAIVYLLFFVGLQIQPYHGLLEPLIARFS